MIITYNSDNHILDGDFINKLITLSKIYQFNKIKTNGNVLIHLQNLQNFVTFTNMPDNLNGFIMYKEEYCISVYYTDLNWTNNKIIPIYDKTIMIKHKIDKILNKNNDILDEIIFENILEY